MKKEDSYEKQMMTTFMSVLITTFKWLCLIVCVVSAGLTIGLLVMGLISGENIANVLLAKMMDLLTTYSEKEVYTLMESIDKTRIIVAGVGYGFATSLTYGLIYYFADKFKILFKSIISEDMFTKENVKMINDCIPLTIIAAFASPVIMYCIIHATGLFKLEDIQVTGIIFICIVYLLKLIFEKGLAIEKRSIKLDKELSDFKARDGEVKLSELKKEIERNEVKKAPVKKESVKKESVKKTVKKEEKKTVKRATKSK